MANSKTYRRLASAHQFGIAAGGWNSLYLAEDHLLLRNTSAFVESYRRFYFSDIEAITICKTMRGYFWNAVWGFALFFFGLTFIYRQGWVSGTGMVIAFAGLLINIARGPTTRAQLQTRVQSRPLPLTRLKPALKTTRMLRDRIAVAQANLPVVEAEPALVERLTPPPLLDSSGPALPPPLPGQAGPSTFSWVHLSSFAMLIIGGVFCLQDVRNHRPALTYLAYLSVAINITLAIASLVRQRQVRLPSQIVPASWVNLAGHLITIPTVYLVFTFAYAFRAARIAGATKSYQPMQMQISDLRLMPGFDRVLFYYAIFSLALGTVGFLLLLFRRRPAVSRPPLT